MMKVDQVEEIKNILMGILINVRYSGCVMPRGVRCSNCEHYEERTERYGRVTAVCGAQNMNLFPISHGA
jgi:hypothetical protein